MSFKELFEKENKFEAISFILLAAVALTGFVISICDIWCEINYSIVCVMLLTAISIHLCLSFFSRHILKKSDFDRGLDSLGDRIVASVGGVKKRIFENAEDADKYIAEKISTAEKIVYDLNWQDSLSDNRKIQRDNEERKRSQAAINESIKSFCSVKQQGSNKKKDKEPIAYKEIFTFPYKSRIDALKEHIAFGENYHCAYYDTKDENNNEKERFPKLQFVIIDEKEVIFVSSLYAPNLCAIQDEKIVSIFCNYFEQAWELSKIIKNDEMPSADTNKIIAEIETKYPLILCSKLK
ncbi:MAG: hypothetical protein LBE91_14465 [Tannerella sp.]|jgi:hypothetical protein|nr:hypothetical protein [Tannerella sp.]